LFEKSLDHPLQRYHLQMQTQHYYEEASLLPLHDRDSSQRIQTTMTTGGWRGRVSRRQSNPVQKTWINSDNGVRMSCATSWSSIVNFFSLASFSFPFLFPYMLASLHLFPVPVLLLLNPSIFSIHTQTRINTRHATLLINDVMV